MHVTKEELVMLCQERKNPNAREIERRAADEARRVGLLGPATAARFEAFNTLPAYVYPTASVERAVVCARWCNWLFFFDDAHDERGAGDTVGDVADAAAKMAAYVALLEDPTGVAGALAGDPLAAYALSFRDDALRLAGAEWMARFVTHVREYLLDGTLSACAHWAAGTVPTVDEYLIQRDRDSAVDTAIDLIELAEGIVLPAEVHADPVMTRLRGALIRSVALFNDVVSYPKEVLRQGNPNNLLHVLERAGLGRGEALLEAIRLVNESARACEEIGEELCARHGGDAPEVRRFVAGVHHWQRGNIESSLREARYRAPESPFVELRA